MKADSFPFPTFHGEDASDEPARGNDDDPQDEPPSREYIESTIPFTRPLTASIGNTQHGFSAPNSPLLKKFSPIQDRRVNAILLEALQLVEFSKDEIYSIEKSIKRLRDAINGFSMLVDKQVNIIGVESIEERGRLKADIQDLCENLKTSNSLLDSTCNRMKKCLASGKNQILAHKRKLIGKAVTDIVEQQECARQYCSSTAARSPSAGQRTPTYGYSGGGPTPTGGLASSPTRPATSQPSPTASRKRVATKVTLASILQYCAPETQRAETFHMSPEFCSSVMDAVGLVEKEFLDEKDLLRFMHEMLSFSIARSSTLTFMGKALHRRLISRYASELVNAIIDNLQPSSKVDPGPMIPQNTFYDFMCNLPFRFDQLVEEVMVDNLNSTDASSLSSGASSPTRSHMANTQHSYADGILPRNASPAFSTSLHKTEPELLETAEQTLAMAKLLHDLATADSEAKQGNKMSVRAQSTRSKAFSKAYLTASRELLHKETGL
ncbi:TPA: hypothetical protein N0F65_012504 [Lagenidium giganteum]|uniref:Uncharacterized protein n=1 Tax=Lagenidium giganteum TaxID=4803 RepID=A0AAV2YRK0_9STRA|nr:TPA: hypothetical protein N0F65_012504 [Lagenidium giganteum]